MDSISEYEEKIKSLEAIIASKDKQLKRSKAFGLNYEYRADEAVRTLMTCVPVLKPRPDKSVIQDRANPTHTLIKGDNLPALVSLLPDYAGKVEVIYIDPPYNTGNNDFIYNDRYLNKEDSYRHSTWLSFMEDRLRLARRLLSDSGVIFVSIDDNEQAHLKLLMDSVFGEQNFRNQIVLSQTVKGLNSQFSELKTLNTGQEYILVYSKTKEFSYHNVSVESNDKRKEGYWTSFKSNADRPTMRYPIGEITIDSGQWKWGAERGLKAYNNYLCYLETVDNVYSEESFRKYYDSNKDDNGDPLLYVRPHGKTAQYFVSPSLTTLPSSNWSTLYNALDVRGKALYGFDTVKNLEMMKHLVRAGGDKNSVILDFFAGSGTTGHAVAELNAEDGGTRKCVLITDAGKSNDNPDAIDIAESVTFERLKRVFTGKGWADGKEYPSMGQNLEMFEIVNIPTVGKEIDYKFTEDGEFVQFYEEKVYDDVKVEQMVQEVSGETVSENWTEPSKAERLIKIWRNAVKHIATNRHNDASLFTKNNQGEKLND